MWTDWIPAGVAVAFITGIISIYGVRQNRKTATETNKLNESDALIKNLSAEVKRQDGRLDKLEETILRQGETIDDQGEQIRRLQTREWSLRRYIYRLIDWGRALGGEPPEPPTDLNL
ncbi:hypothetical protein AAFP32_11970 [Brevibacterium sp. CBA3109]|uniref:DUF2746 domain-containing protein n=1 Tax=Brevibacterium koreense TaxID=3140787 RepID=A0AAU7UIL8_9MICO